MQFNWVISQTYKLPAEVNPADLKNIGPLWGSWQTCQNFETDNVVCYDRNQARDFVNRGFQNTCNFYIHQSLYATLNRPPNVKLFDSGHVPETHQIEDIIALQLAAENADIILMLGFKLGELIKPEDRFEGHKLQNYYGLIYSLLNRKNTVQFVLIDHPADLDKSYAELSNITRDTLNNVLSFAQTAM